jgi:hypothetical protein
MALSAIAAVVAASAAAVLAVARVASLRLLSRSSLTALSSNSGGASSPYADEYQLRKALAAVSSSSVSDARAVRRSGSNGFVAGPDKGRKDADADAWEGYC